MSDIFLKKIELSRTCRTNEHYFTLNCALIGAYKYDSYDSWQWLMVYESSYDDSGSGSFRFSFLFEGNLTRRHQEFWIWSLWAEAIFAYRNCQWRDLLIRQLFSNSYWFIPDNDSSKHFIYLFKGSFWIIVGFAQVTIRIESWRIKSRIFERRDFLFYQTRPVAD